MDHQLHKWTQHTLPPSLYMSLEFTSHSLQLIVGNNIYGVTTASDKLIGLVDIG